MSDWIYVLVIGYGLGTFGTNLVWLYGLGKIERRLRKKVNEERQVLKWPGIPLWKEILIRIGYALNLDRGRGF